MKLKDAPWKESYEKPRQVAFKKQRHHFANKGPYIQRDFFFFSSNHIRMQVLDQEQG